MNRQPVSSVSQEEVDPALPPDLRQTFLQLARDAADQADSEIAKAAAVMTDLLTIAELFSEDPSMQHRADEIIAFCGIEALPSMTDPSSRDAVRIICQQAENRWSDDFALLAPEERCDHQGQQDRIVVDDDGGETQSCVSHDAQEAWSTDGPQRPTMPENLAAILASLQPTDLSTPEQPVAADVLPISQFPQPPAASESIDDPEMLAAFTDDSQHCLSEMESSLLCLESGPSDPEPVRSFCRQLHTLKGAAGTVGLSQLATYLHDLETCISDADGAELNIDQLLNAVDVVRSQLAAAGVTGTEISAGVTDNPSIEFSDSEKQPTTQPPSTPVLNAAVTERGSTEPTVSAPVRSAAGSEDDVYVRVEASRLERLMDLLTELVMLRNRRDSHLDSLRELHNELNQCAVRSRTVATGIDMQTSIVIPESTDADIDGRPQNHRVLTGMLDEVCLDITELGQSLQQVYGPLSDDNSAVSHLIGRFRQELMELRRLPVSGLFQRLQRAIRDAARAEGKQVHVRVEGDGARAERSVQERLFEPLLHLVRNAVSHGIRPETERRERGKSATGEITLAAWSDATCLCVEVRDDGCGLSDDALYQRGIELGLLTPGEQVSQSQLWKLIFRPGFSTKSSVSQISGRGVGMDVVDRWVRQLRGRIEVESVPELGTTFRLQIPLRSAVEHALIVSAGGQLFAVPMQAVDGTSDSVMPRSGLQQGTAPHPVVSLNRILGRSENPASRGCHLLLKDPVRSAATSPSAACLTIAVDAIVGVEEVVVRGLPPLLQNHKLLAGVTLSGRSEIVLLLDVRQLLKQCETADAEQSGENSDGRAGTAAGEGRRCILVVDDSVTVRRSLSRKLTAVGYDVRQAGNGRAAADLLRTESFCSVVTDIDMPGMNGVELLQQIRRQKHLQSLPVVVLTSRDDASMLPGLQELNPSAILPKPVTENTIAAIIDSFNRARAPDDSLTEAS